MQPGEYEELMVVSVKEHGVYLGERADADEKSRVLLPKKYVPAGTKPGGRIRVFLYRDSEDRLIATTERPALTLHEIAPLKVAQVTRIGAFLDWGLEKDLFLPFHEQTKRVRTGETVLAALYLDKSGRLAATMKLYDYLRTDSPYLPNQTVTATVYQIAPNFGVFAAVDDLYSGMIPKKEMNDGFEVGQKITARVTYVKPDGKLDLSVRGKAWQVLGEDAESVLDIITNDYGGELPFDDKASPETIRDVFGLSKAAFKRAVGHLMKEGRAEIADGRIRASAGQTEEE